MLMAEGFVEAKLLASKFYSLYALLRELLSKQMHYDWGLRAIKSVLVVAGSFKRAEPDMPEQSLLMRALRDFVSLGGACQAPAYKPRAHNAQHGYSCAYSACRTHPRL
jgi:hypothetical protein